MNNEKDIVQQAIDYDVAIEMIARLRSEAIRRKQLATTEEERLEEYNNWIVFVRGNHDNPAYFDGKHISHWRWVAVPDYTVIRACGHTILCIGGAITMERTWREASPYHHFHPTDPFQPDLYWPAEEPVYEQARLDAITDACAIDTVITHTAPSFCEPKEKHTSCMKQIIMNTGITETGYSCSCDLLPGWVVAGSNDFEHFKKEVKESIDFYVDCAKADGEKYPTVLESDYEIIYKFDVQLLLEYGNDLLSSITLDDDEQN